MGVQVRVTGTKKAPLGPFSASRTGGKLNSLAFRLQFLELGLKLVLGLGVFRVNDDAVYRANLNTLGLVVVTNTLGAVGVIDLVDLVPLADCTIRALGFAYIAVNTFVGNHQCHGTIPPANLPKSANTIVVY